MEHHAETGNLIGADKVVGTTVYNAEGDTLGSIHDIMVDKQSGRVAYAVMSFGGFLGLGSDYHPLPWSTLTYDTDKGGYIVHLSREQLEGGPRFHENEEPSWNDREYEKRVHDYYGIGPYWM